MLAYRYIEKGKFALVEKPKPSLIEPTDAIATIVALYEKPQQLPLPQMYGKNLTFKTGGVDGCDCEENYVINSWKCLHNCELCGKCNILRGRDPETLYADYIEGKRQYIDITMEIRDRR